MVAAGNLSPVQRRRRALAPVEGPPHDTELVPLLPGMTEAAGETGMIIAAAEQDFLAAVMADLGAADWRSRLRARFTARRGADGVAELYQPMHQHFHLVLLEAACVVPGRPRLDPEKILGSGLVLRRVAEDWEQGPRQGWMQDGPSRRGWLSVSDNADPDPATRREIPTAGHPAIDALIAAHRGGPRLAEEVLPLFVAPPAVCDALGKTVLFGLVPLASSELSEAGPPAPDFAAEAETDGGALRRHLSAYLKARPKGALPQAGNVLSKDWADSSASAAPDASLADADASDAGRMKSFQVLLQQLAMELGAFGEAPPARALMALLSQISLPLERDAEGKVVRSTDAAVFLPRAAAILLEREENPDGVRMPLEWPAIDEATGERLTQAALTCMSARFAQVSPRTGKLDGASRRYAVRAFIRVKQEEGCPPKLCWSDYSENFRILPWYAGDAPPIQVPLPDATDRDLLKNLKPGVTFELPPSLANLLRGNPEDLQKGKGNTGGLTIGWLCSFSIPLITICAFIVLNIFLQLFDLVFRWMLWIKICIPIPKRRGD